MNTVKSLCLWFFVQKQSLIPGQDCETICGLLDSIKTNWMTRAGAKLIVAAGGLWRTLTTQMADSAIGVPHTECYGVRLPFDYKGDVPIQMLMIDVPEAEYIVFEHGPFDYDQENCSVGKKMEKAMATFDFAGAGYCFDTSPGIIIYFCHDPTQFWKYIRPVQKL